MLARSQSSGGMIGGIGFETLGQTEIDPRSGRLVNANLTEYGVPHMVDTLTLDVTFVTEEDRNIGEIPLVGVAASIVKSIFHATATGLRHLRIISDPLVMAQARRGISP